MVKIVERGKAEGTLAASVDARIVVTGAPAVLQMKFARRNPEQIARFLRSLVETTIGPLSAP